MKLSRILLLLIVISPWLLNGCSTTGKIAPVSGPSNTKANIPGNVNKVAILLPLNGNFANAGKAVRNGFLAGYYADTAHVKSTSVHVYDTSKNADISQTYNKAIQEGAQIVMGPLTKQDVQQLMAGTNISVPTVTLNSVASFRNPPSNLYEFGFSPQNEAIQVAEKAHQDGHRSAIMIVLGNDWGKNIANAFSSRWKQLGGSTVDALYFNQNQDLDAAIKKLLRFSELTAKRTPAKLRKYAYRHDFDTIFLVAPPTTARQIVPLLRFYFAGNAAIYSTSVIYGGTPNPSVYHDMDGVIFCDIPWIFNNPNFLAREPRLYALGLDAYYLTTHLGDLSNTPGLPGSTGKLYLGKQHHILQKLAWAQFKDGNAVAL